MPRGEHLRVETRRIFLGTDVGAAMMFQVEVEQESDGRWIAEVVELSGAMAYGATREEAISKVQALALRVVTDRLDQDE